MIYAFFFFFLAQKSFLTNFFFIFAEINLTTLGPLYIIIVLFLCCFFRPLAVRRCTAVAYVMMKNRYLTQWTGSWLLKLNVCSVTHCKMYVNWIFLTTNWNCHFWNFRKNPQNSFFCCWNFEKSMKENLDSSEIYYALLGWCALDVNFLEKWFIQFEWEI